ncbi:hypothetical protein PRUPE_1G382500 [Prunus persica]|uniref:Transmembrane protein n=1 Tax=Prunus persica TaxID=3760 RepID=A0A251RCC9_PRUPE|nr:hypothetical protein PRUPE_1G382500 [Prunus persica]
MLGLEPRTLSEGVNTPNHYTSGSFARGCLIYYTVILVAFVLLLPLKMNTCWRSESPWLQSSLIFLNVLLNFRFRVCVIYLFMQHYMKKGLILFYFWYVISSRIVQGERRGVRFQVNREGQTREKDL